MVTTIFIVVKKRTHFIPWFDMNHICVVVHIYMLFCLPILWVVSFRFHSGYLGLALFGKPMRIALTENGIDKRLPYSLHFRCRF